MPITLYRRGRFWWLTGTDATGTRVHQSTGFTEKVQADQIRIQREKEGLDARLLGRKAVYTFAQAVEDYLLAGGDDHFLEKLVLHFGDRRISSLTGTLVRAAAMELYPAAAYTTWNRQVVTPVRAVINMAADAGNCDPIKIKGFTTRDRNVRRPSTPKKRAVDRSYIDAFRQHSDDPRLSALMLFMYQTGARISDALKLRDDSEDVDLVHRKVVFRNMKNGEDGEADLTIEMVYEIQQLREWKARRRQEWQKARVLWGVHRKKQSDTGLGAKKPNDRLFGFIARGSVYAGIRRICKAAGLPYLGTHQPGRHSFATEMIVRNNVDVATTAEKGRWKSKGLLMETYVHGIEGQSVIDRVFGSTQPSSDEKRPSQ